MTRPEWIKCVASGKRTPRGAVTMCRRFAEPFEWLFEDAKHATGAVNQGTRLQPCERCMNAVKSKRAEQR
jgi:predicted PP-loop superfamily ATPase